MTPENKISRRGRKRTHAAYIAAREAGMYTNGSHDRKMARYAQQYPEGK